MSECSCHSHNGFLTSRGYQLAAVLAKKLGVDTSEAMLYLDKVDSVSGPAQAQDQHALDLGLDPDDRRVPYGS